MTRTEEPGPAVGPGAIRALGEAFNEVGFTLLRHLPSDENRFLSSLGIGAAFAALLPGARGETRAELTSFLGVGDDPESAESALCSLRDSLRPGNVTVREWDEDNQSMVAVEREWFRLGLATGFFVEESWPLHTAYCETLRENYEAEFFSVAFSDPKAAADRINEWVGDRTEGRITNLVSPDSFAKITRCVLTNAVHFKAQWLDQFSPESTVSLPFHLASGAEIRAPMMCQTTDYAYWEDGTGDVRVLRLPYEHGLSMLVLLPPPGGTGSLEARLSSALLRRINDEAVSRLVELQMPKFELRDQIRLGAALRRLGLSAAFDPARADFRGITPSKEGLVLSQVVHQAWARVDEEGTEAAAGTTLTMLGGALEPLDPVPFIVDRPFLFLIQEDRTGTLLFLGRVMDPSD